MPTPPNYIQAFLDYLRSEVDASPMTIHAYSVDLWAFLAYTEERLGEPFTPTEHDLDLVRNWLSHRLDTGSKASSVGKYLASLKSYYRYLLRCGIIRVNPIQSLRPPKADKPLTVYVPTAELNRLIDESSEAQDWIGVRDQLLLSILYECGLRRSELAGLLDRNVDIHARQLKVLGKGRKERIVPFGEGLAEAIKHWRDVRDERFGSTETLLVTSRGGAMSPEAVYQVVHRALRLCAPPLPSSERMPFVTPLPPICLTRGATLCSCVSSSVTTLSPRPYVIPTPPSSSSSRSTKLIPVPATHRLMSPKGRANPFLSHGFPSLPSLSDTRTPITYTLLYSSLPHTLYLI